MCIMPLWPSGKPTKWSISLNRVQCSTLTPINNWFKYVVRFRADRVDSLLHFTAVFLVTAEGELRNVRSFNSGVWRFWWTCWRWWLEVGRGCGIDGTCLWACTWSTTIVVRTHDSQVFYLGHVVQRNGDHCHGTTSGSLEHIEDTVD